MVFLLLYVGDIFIDSQYKDILKAYIEDGHKKD